MRVPEMIPTASRSMDPYDAQDLVKGVEEELGVKAVPFGEFVYLPDEERYEDVRRLKTEHEDRSVLRDTSTRMVSRWRSRSSGLVRASGSRRCDC